MYKNREKEERGGGRWGLWSRDEGWRGLGAIATVSIATVSIASVSIATVSIATVAIATVAIYLIPTSFDEPRKDQPAREKLHAALIISPSIYFIGRHIKPAKLSRNIQSRCARAHAFLFLNPPSLATGKTQKFNDFTLVIIGYSG